MSTRWQIMLISVMVQVTIVTRVSTTSWMVVFQRLYVWLMVMVATTILLPAYSITRLVSTLRMSGRWLLSSSWLMVFVWMVCSSTILTWWLTMPFSVSTITVVTSTLASGQTALWLFLLVSVSYMMYLVTRHWSSVVVLVSSRAVCHWYSSPTCQPTLVWYSIRHSWMQPRHGILRQVRKRV